MCITALRPCYHPCDEWLRAERSQRWLLRGLPTGSTAAPRQGMFSSLTSVAALLTAIATLLLVLEMRRQRKALYKRQFVCEDAQFVARPSDGFPLGLHLSRPGSDGEAKSRSQLRVRCTNIGPGPAKRVEYEWSYDPQQIIESVAATGVSVDGIWLDGPLLRIGTDDTPEKIVHSLRGQNSGIRAVVHSRGADDSMTLHIPPAYVDLLGLWFSATAPKPEASASVFVLEPPGITLTLSCEDIEDGRHTKRFVLRPKLRMMSSRDAAIDYAEGALGVNSFTLVLTVSAV